MENLNIFGICLKIWFLGRVSQKTNTERRELPNKGVLGQFADLRKGGGGGGGLGKKEDVAFLKRSFRN